MKVTALSAQQKNPQRINVFIDGVYMFSLTLQQIVDGAIKIGKEVSQDDLDQLQSESQFGKLYQRTLEYVLMRPRSAKEVRDYLYKKTLTRPYRKRTGEVSMRSGVDSSVTTMVYEKLSERGYIDDQRFAEFWVESRHRLKGASNRKLQSELASKGVPASIVESVLDSSDRNDTSELQKVLLKKRHKYSDDTKLMAYLARQGFSYDDIKQALEEPTE